jgi:hypothetical protein
MPYVAFVAVAVSRRGIHLPLRTGPFQSNNHHSYSRHKFNSLILNGFNKT